MLEKEEQKKFIQENPSSDSLPANPQRREFLKRLAQLGAAIAGLTLFPDKLMNNGKPRQAAILPIPESPQDGTLTPEKLRESNIKIYQGQTTELRLKNKVFQLPLFRDAKEHKFDELVIVLIEADTLSWNATRKLPGDARAIYDSLFLTPKEKYPRRLEAVKSILASTDADEKLRKLAEEEWERLKDKQKWMQYYADHGDAAGQLVRTDNIPGYAYLNPKAATFLQMHPELSNKIYIFFSVGGKFTPTPDQSYLSPSQIEEYATNKPRDAWNYKFDAPTPGFILRHESKHYETFGTQAREWDTDDATFNSFSDAWNKFQQTGDSSGYPFVFINTSGITTTQNISRDNQSSFNI